jgi:hypothetical protein
MDAERRLLLKARLKEAEESLHNLNMGIMARVFVDQNGERIEYGPTNAAGLNKYIYTLKLELGLVVSGPISPWM